MLVIEHLKTLIREAGIVDLGTQIPPHCILWPDADRQWEQVIPTLQQHLPELIVLGEYNPEMRTGPAIWIRCAIAGVLEEYRCEYGLLPVIYLPGYSRQQLRNVDACPNEIKLLFELQFRGVIWSQANGRDWTPLSLLVSQQAGLDLKVSQDNEAKQALLRALPHLLEEEAESLRGKALDAGFFNSLVTGGDINREILCWLENPNQYRARQSENEWESFVETCKTGFKLDPETDGPLTAATRLALGKKPWDAVWKRFCEAPNVYPNIPNTIRRCQMPEMGLFDGASDAGGWPQWNDARENELRLALVNLKEASAQEARRKLLELESRHGPRRSLVWYKLGEASLAGAIGFLAELAVAIENCAPAGNLDGLAAKYISEGWKADNAALQAIAETRKEEDRAAVTAALSAVYLPWLQECARFLQRLSGTNGYPGEKHSSGPEAPIEDGTCIMFVDGLRFDASKRLKSLLESRAYGVQEAPMWAALPTVTATGKPAVSPVRYRITGNDENNDFEPSVVGDGSSLQGGYHLKRLLREEGWQILDQGDDSPAGCKAWCEFGNIDHEGHTRGSGLARYLDGLLEEIAGKVEHLLSLGWRQVRIVTDHGWLLMPGGLPKTDLPASLTLTKWARCAALAGGSQSDEALFSWYWNPVRCFALADGASCYRKGEEYAHGGMSLQECLIQELCVSPVAAGSAAAVTIEAVNWKGLRCLATVKGNPSGLLLDIRREPVNSGSSLASGAKAVALKSDGSGSVLVEDETLEGSQAYLVIVDTSGNLVAQSVVMIGGD